MGEWNAWQNSKPGGGSALESAVSALPPNVKQALYGATMSGPVRRGSWDNCAFNKAGRETLNVNITSTTAAAEHFNCSATLVSRFITSWDATMPLISSDVDATNLLREILIRVGLFSDPNEKKHRRILRLTVHKNAEEAAREALEAEIEKVFTESPTMDMGLAWDIASAELLLTGCAS